MREVNFIKGHMGGNRIVLLDARQIPEGQALATALFALSDLGLSGHQVGLCRPGSAPDRIRVRVVSVSWRDFIPACGGLTQVLGRALADGSLAEDYGLVPGADGGLDIEFDAWPARVRPQGTQVETDLGAFARLCAEQGIEPMDLEGVSAWRVGTFLVIEADRIQIRHPAFDGARFDPSDQAILLTLHKAFQERTGQESWDLALYDWHPDTPAHLRVVFPHAIPIGHIEPACGTGTVALGLALTASGELKRRDLIDQTLRCETGGGPRLGGDEETSLRLCGSSGNIDQALLRHSRVELVAQGRLNLKKGI